MTHMIRGKGHDIWMQLILKWFSREVGHLGTLVQGYDIRICRVLAFFIPFPWFLNYFLFHSFFFKVSCSSALKDFFFKWRTTPALLHLVFWTPEVKELWSRSQLTQVSILAAKLVGRGKWLAVTPSWEQHSWNTKKTAANSTSLQGLVIGKGLGFLNCSPAEKAGFLNYLCWNHPGESYGQNYGMILLLNESFNSVRVSN